MKEVWEERETSLECWANEERLFETVNRLARIVAPDLEGRPVTVMIGPEVFSFGVERRVP